MDSIIKKESLRVSKVIECGYFGGSITVKNNDQNTDMKVRIVKKEYAGKNETEWEKFSHPNIQPLLQLQYLQNQETYLFHTSAEEITLEEKVKDKLFKKQTQAPWKIISWLEGIANAVQYLHSCGYAHMKLEAKSIIITENDVAQISQFHHISSIKTRTDR